VTSDERRDDVGAEALEVSVERLAAATAGRRPASTIARGVFLRKKNPLVLSFNVNFRQTLTFPSGDISVSMAMSEDLSFLLLLQLSSGEAIMRSLCPP
jgi:hypothetical protein